MAMEPSVRALRDEIDPELGKKPIISPLFILKLMILPTQARENIGKALIKEYFRFLRGRSHRDHQEGQEDQTGHGIG
jgi:hypothetical protein